MFKLVLEKAEEPEIKLPTSAGSWKKQESSGKTSISALLTMPKPLNVWITINCGKFWKNFAEELMLLNCGVGEDLRVPWTARRSNQSILKETSPGCSLEGKILRLKLQYVGHLIWRVNSLERTLMLGGIGGRRKGDDRGWVGWMASPAWWTWVWVNSESW